MARRDPNTLDLFADYQPPAVAPAYPAEVLAAASPRVLVSKALACALERDPRTRSELAAALSDQLGEPISDTAIDAWASPARETNNVAAYRLFGLLPILQSADPTNAAGLLNSVLAGSDLIACDRRFEELISRELARDAAQDLIRRADIHDAKWRAQK